MTNRTRPIRLASHGALSYQMHAGTQPGNYALREATHQVINKLFHEAEREGITLDPTSITLMVDRATMVPAYHIRATAEGEKQS